MEIISKVGNGSIVSRMDTFFDHIHGYRGFNHSVVQWIITLADKIHKQFTSTTVSSKVTTH